MQVENIKRQAAGRWPEILQHAGFPADCLTGKSCPCPKCGGTDRFRFIDEQAGAVYCNQCFKSGNGDGLAAIEWLTGCDFKHALYIVADYLGCDTTPPNKAKSNGKSYPSLDALKASWQANPGESVQWFDYTDRDDSSVVFAVVRIDKPDGKTFRQFHADNGQWFAGGLSKNPLFKATNDLSKTVCLIVEGERKALIAAQQLGEQFDVVAWAGGANGTAKADWSYLCDYKADCFVVLPDNDKTGRDAASKVCEQVTTATSKPVKLIELPSVIEQGEKSDIQDALEARGREHVLSELQAAIALTPNWQSQAPEQARQTTEKSKPKAKLIRMSDVKAEQIQWLWYGRIPLGKVSMFSGNGGLGKSYVSLDIAARISNGSPWPDDESGYAPLGDVIILNSEDGLTDTIRPRLDALGANMPRIHYLESIKLDDYERPFSLAQDLALLDDAIRETSNVKLIIIDPISSYLGSIDANKSADVRRVLDPLKGIAEQTGAAVLLINHLTKGSGPAVYRACGSVAIQSMVRTAWAFAAADDDDERRLILPTKNNVGKETHGMAYKIVDGQVIWESAPVTISADDALEYKPQLGRGGGATKAATEWLRERLSGGSVESKVIFDEGLKNGHAKRTLNRCKEALSISAHREGGRTGKWYWSLPVEDGQFDNLAISTDEWPTLTKPHKNTDEIKDCQLPGDMANIDNGQDRNVPPNGYQELVIE